MYAMLCANMFEEVQATCAHIGLHCPALESLGFIRSANLRTPRCEDEAAAEKPKAQIAGHTTFLPKP